MRRLCCFALTLLACAGAPQNPHSALAAHESEYRVGPGDVLEITVWREPGLSTSMPVRPDGRFSMPLAGEVIAAGRTTHELEGEIKALLSATLSSPQVTVSVKEINAAEIFVLGEVQKPGAYPLRKPLHLLQALALAGGLTEFADHDIVVLRRQGDAAVRLTVDYDTSVLGQTPFELSSGDTIVVR